MSELLQNLPMFLDHSLDCLVWGNWYSHWFCQICRNHLINNSRSESLKSRKSCSIPAICSLTNLWSAHYNLELAPCGGPGTGVAISHS